MWESILCDCKFCKFEDQQGEIEIKEKSPLPPTKKKKMKGQHISFIQVREDKDRALGKRGSVWKCLSVYPLWWWSQINRWNVSILSPLTSLKSAALSCFLEFSLWIFFFGGGGGGCSSTPLTIQSIFQFGDIKSSSSSYTEVNPGRDGGLFQTRIAKRFLWISG